MFLDGLLVAARYLVNGATIVQARDMDRVDYFHLELDSHDVILAEGAPSESFLDDDNRWMFHNASEFVAAYPARLSVHRYCAPRVEQGPALERIQRWLAKISVAA